MLTGPILLGLLLAQTSPNLNVPQGTYNRADSSKGVFGAEKVTQEFPLAGYTFQYGINTDLVTATTDGGTVTQSANMAVIATGTGATASAILQSRGATRYTPGQGVRIRFTAVWTTCTANSRQEVGIGNATDGFFFGCSGATFGIFHRNNGAETFVPQTAWNGVRPTFNVTKGNVYSIAYQWLGFGVIRFQMELPSGEFVLVHQINYPNTATVTSLQNPILRFWARALNSGNTSNVSVRVPSVGIVSEGPPSTFAVPNGTIARKSLSGTYAAVVTLRNKSTFIDAGNQNRVHLVDVHISATGNGDINCEFIRNTALGGTPTYTDTNTATSFTDVDTAGTTVTGGRIMRTVVVEGGGGTLTDPFDGEYLEPGETFTVACQSLTASPTVGAALNWNEEF